MILASHGIIASQIASADPDWLAYYNRVIAAGGSLSTTEQNATKTLVADLKAYGIWSAMKAVYPMVGASAAACAQNLKSSSFTGTFTSTGWTFASTGATPNGTSAYFNTNLPSNTMANGSTHMCYYSRSNIVGSGVIDMGTESPDFLLWYNAFSLSLVNFGNNMVYVPTITDTRGFLLGSRYSTSNGLIQFNSTQQLKISLTGDTRSTKNIFIGAINTGSPAGYYSAKETAFNSIGDGLTDTQSSNLYTAVQAFQRTLSRQV
jgi:hypothetical protein